MKKTLIFLLSVGILTSAFVGHTFATSPIYNVADFAEPFSSVITVKKANYFDIDTGSSTPLQVEMVDVTSEMTPEANKIEEYKAENISLSSGNVIKKASLHGSTNITFEHCWPETNVNTNSSGDYIVPMTSTSYTLYLKYYNDNSTKIYVKAEKDVLFFQPNNGWKEANARFAANLFDNSKGLQEWADFVETSPGSGIYKVNLGNYRSLNIVRMNPASSVNSWSNKWNQSGDISIANYDTNNCITNYSWDGWTASSNSSWSAR